MINSIRFWRSEVINEVLPAENLGWLEETIVIRGAHIALEMAVAYTSGRNYKLQALGASYLHIIDAILRAYPRDCRRIYSRRVRENRRLSIVIPCSDIPLYIGTIQHLVFRIFRGEYL